MARSRPERPLRLHRPSGAIYHRLAVAAGDDRAARRHPRRPVSRAARAFGGFDGGALIFFARSHEATKIYSSVDRKSVGKGKSVYVRVDLGSRRIIKKKTENKQQ